MIAASMHDFFVAAASVAGAFIGLLFVAISVTGARLALHPEEQVNRIRARAALTTFLNSLVVSMFALISTTALSNAALVCAVIGLVFVISSALSLVRRSRARSDLRDAAFLLGLLVVLIWELTAGLELRTDPHPISAVQTLAVLIVLCFVIGVSRSWELIGAPESDNVGRETVRLLRRSAHRPSKRAQTPPTGA